MANELKGPTGIWFCKIGETDKPLPMGCDYPMRRAVEKAYQEITGENPKFIFSGWSTELTDMERSIVDDDKEAMIKAAVNG